LKEGKRKRGGIDKNKTKQGRQEAKQQAEAETRVTRRGANRES